MLRMNPGGSCKVRFEDVVGSNGERSSGEGSGLRDGRGRAARVLDDSIRRLDEYIDSLSRQAVHDDFYDDPDTALEDLTDGIASCSEGESISETPCNDQLSLGKGIAGDIDKAVHTLEGTGVNGTEMVESAIYAEIKETVHQNESDEDNAVLGLNLGPDAGLNSAHPALRPRDSVTLKKNKMLNIQTLPPIRTPVYPSRIPDIDSSSSSDSEVLGVILEMKAKDENKPVLELQRGVAAPQARLPQSNTKRPTLPAPKSPKPSRRMPPAHSYGARSTPEIITIDILKKIKTKPSPSWMKEAKLDSGSDSALNQSKPDILSLQTDEDPDDNVALAKIISKTPEPSSKPSPAKKPLTVKKLCKKTTVRIYIEVPGVFQDVTLLLGEDCAKVTNRIIELASLDRSRGWTLFEINRTFLMERPLFDWEYPMKVVLRWSQNTSENHSLFLKPYPYKLILRPEQVLEKFLTKDGYLYRKVSPKKWKRKYHVLKKGTLYSYSSEGATQHEHSSDLSDRHIYTSFSNPTEKDPGKIQFLLVSETPASAFCNKDDRIHSFATTSEQSLFSWVTALRVARAKRELLSNPHAFVNSSSHAVKARAEELIRALREDRHNKELSAA